MRCQINALFYFSCGIIIALSSFGFLRITESISKSLPGSNNNTTYYLNLFFLKQKLLYQRFYFVRSFVRCSIDIIVLKYGHLWHLLNFSTDFYGFKLLTIRFLLAFSLSSFYVALFLIDIYLSIGDRVLLNNFYEYGFILPLWLFALVPNAQSLSLFFFSNNVIIALFQCFSINAQVVSYAHETKYFYFVRQQFFDCCFIKLSLSLSLVCAKQDCSILFNSNPHIAILEVQLFFCVILTQTKIPFCAIKCYFCFIAKLMIIIIALPFVLCPSVH